VDPPCQWTNNRGVIDTALALGERDAGRARREGVQERRILPFAETLGASVPCIQSTVAT